MLTTVIPYSYIFGQLVVTQDLNFSLFKNSFLNFSKYFIFNIMSFFSGNWQQVFALLSLSSDLC